MTKRALPEGRVSVGLPTYNGERFIRQSLESLLRQDGLLEIVVSDNASTDRTAEIVAEYPVTYIRQSENVGAAENFNRAFRATSGDYFMWASDHDLWDPSFVSRSLRWLTEYPGRVLAYPRTVIIDADGVEVQEVPELEMWEESALTRYRRLVWKLAWGNPIYGLIRREALEKTGLMRPVIGADHLLLAELALQGPFQLAHRATFYRREVRSETAGEAHRRHLAELAPLTGGYRALRDEHQRAVLRSDLSPLAKGLAWLDTRRAFRMRFGV